MEIFEVMEGDEIPYKDGALIREGSLSWNPEEQFQLERGASWHRTGREGRRQHLQKRQNNAEVLCHSCQGNPVLEFTFGQETPPLGGEAHSCLHLSQICF